MELGLPITQAQVDELKAHVDDIDYEAARRHEERVRHDVMAHVHAYGDVCPNARGIIHLGATSCYVTDNADILMLRDAPDAGARKGGGGAPPPARLRAGNTRTCRRWATRICSRRS